jgi:hypothetical protein
VPEWFILAALIKRKEREELDEDEPVASRIISGNWPVCVAVICAVAIAWCVVGDRSRLPIEPFSFTDGISIFPTYMIFHLALLLSAYLIAKAHFDLKASTWKICKKFQLYRIERKWNAVRWDDFFWSNPRTDGEPVDMATLWETYQERGMFLSRLCRVIPMSVLYLVAILKLISLLGEASPQLHGRAYPPVHPPGWLALCLQFSFKYLKMFIPVALSFFVIDATRLQAEFVRRCREAPTEWPPGTYRKYSYFLSHVGADNLARYLDIRFIAMRTDAVNTLIYYPFIIIFLFVLGKIDYFNDFPRPMAQTILEALYLLLALYCAYRLPTIANEYREETVKKLNRSLNSAIVEKEREQKKVLRQIIYKIRNLDQGAFVRLWDQPALRAILLPSGGIGIWTLVQFLPR